MNSEKAINSKNNRKKSLIFAIILSLLRCGQNPDSAASLAVAIGMSCVPAQGSYR